MAIITVGDSTFDWSGVWTHTKSGFTVDRDLISAREIAELADRGLTHVYGSEAAAKWNSLNKAGKATEAEKPDITNAAREAYREAMYGDSWATGTRAARSGTDRLDILFWQDVFKRTREIANANFQTPTGAKDSWIDPANGEAYDLKHWADRYLDNDDPDDSDPDKTKGAVRREIHMNNAALALADEQKRAQARLETRKITGTKI